MTPAADRRMGCHRFPAVTPDATRAEHAVELPCPCCRSLRVVEAIAHAHAVEGALRMPLDRCGRLHPQRIEDRRDDVNGMVVLLANLATHLEAGWPRDDARVACAAVELVALPHLERRVEGHRPAVR